MDKYDLIEFIGYSLILTLPLTYFLATVYIPYNYSSSLYTSDSSEVKEYVSEHQPVTVRQIEESTSLTYFQSYWIVRELSLEGELARYQDGIKINSSVALKQSKKLQ